MENMLVPGGMFGDLRGPHCVSDNLEVVQAENGILRRKVASKTEGLVILSREVEDLKEELVQVKALNRHLANEGEEELTSKCMVSSRMRCLGFSTSSARERNRIALHRQLRSKNLALQEERDRLKAQLEEAKGDVAVWREKVDREREDKMREGRIELCVEPVEERERRVREMEEVQVRQAKLKQDLQRLLDEREDLVREKEELGRKLHRVSYQLSRVLALDTTGLLDIDHILMENKFLTEQLSRVKEEKDLANQMGRRYKEALDKVRAVKSNEGRREEVRRLLRQLSFPVPQPVDVDSLAGLETLTTWLLETLADRQLQARHQRLANRELAARLATLEERLSAVEGGPILCHPSQVIMEGYKPDSSEYEKEKNLSNEVDNQVRERVELKQKLMRNHLQAQERLKGKMRNGAELKREETGSQEAAKAGEDKVSLSCDQGSNKSSADQHKLQAPAECENPRTPTPDYADLNARFENLLGLIGGEETLEKTSKETLAIRDDPEVVRYSCSQPPDLIPLQTEVELEEVSITLDGLSIGGPRKDVLPDHIERMVHSALKDLN